MSNEITTEIAGGTSITFYTYLIYLAISIALTIWVARTLHKNGRVFLVDAEDDGFGEAIRLF